MKRLAALLIVLSCSALLAASAFRLSSESPLVIAVSPDATNDSRNIVQ